MDDKPTEPNELAQLRERMAKLETLFRLQQEGMNLLKTGLEGHQKSLEALADLMGRRVSAENN